MKAVKESYISLVTTLEHDYETFHEPEALGLCKVLSKFSTIASIYLLDYVLPIVAKLSLTLQKQKLDLSSVSSLVKAVLNTLDGAVTPAANWILEILSAKDNLIQVTKETINADRLHQFQHTIGKPFIANLELVIKVLLLLLFTTVTAADGSTCE